MTPTLPTTHGDVWKMNHWVTAGVNPAYWPQGAGESGLPRGTPTLPTTHGDVWKMNAWVTAGVNPAYWPPPHSMLKARCVGPRI
jgi:hypothetical protein